MTVLEIQNIDIFCNINLDQNVIIRYNNLDCKVLIVMFPL